MPYTVRSPSIPPMRKIQEDPKKVSAAIKDQLKLNHISRSTHMAQHGLVKRKQNDVEDHIEELTLMSLIVGAGR